MTEQQQQHAITPPPELVERLRKDAPRDIRDAGVTRERHLVIAAYRAGADQELHALLTWLRVHHYDNLASDLRAARRPKPPSLAEQALAELDQISTHDNEGRTVGGDASIIRAALERLQELESDG